MLRDIIDYSFCWLISKLSWLVVFFAPTGSIILSIGFIILANAYTGIKASRKKGEQFEWKKLREVWDKFTSYGVGILVAYVIQVKFFPHFPAIQGMASLVIYLELKLLNENIEAVTGLNMFQGLMSFISKKKQ